MTRLRSHCLEIDNAVRTMYGDRPPAEVFPVHSYVLDAMEGHQWKVEDLAYYSKSSTDRLSDLLNGKAEPRLCDLMSFSWAFNTTFDYWLRLDAIWRIYGAGKDES